jgi:hypothetical protein
MPGPVSDSYMGPIDPIVQRIYNNLREMDVANPASTAQEVIDAIEGAFELHGTPANVLRCAFCGQEYPAGTPATKHKALTDHIMQCEAHPLRAVIRERDNLLLEKASFIDRLNTYLREEFPPPAPQAEMKDNIKTFLDMLVARFRHRAKRRKELDREGCKS